MPGQNTTGASVPVYAVLAAEAASAVRVLPSWSLCLVVQVMWVAASTADTYGRSDRRPELFVWWLPMAGAAVVALLATRVTQQVSAQAA